MDVVQFYTDEANAIHETLDKVFIPREVEGAKLSMSQRVDLLAKVFASLAATTAAITKAKQDAVRSPQ